MAKKKEEAPSRIGNILAAAKAAHQREVGAGGSVYDPYMSHVRCMRFPSLALMGMFGFTGLRDSCTVLIDGAPGSSKSSLGIEMFNWGYDYGVGGAIIDGENKAAVDIALGTLKEETLWLPGHLEMQSATSVEDAQRRISNYVEKCAAINMGLPRDAHIPMMTLMDPLAGLPSEETIKAFVKAGGSSDRGHAGRAEALLWSAFIKAHESSIINVPFISIFVNHVKERQKQIAGAKQIMEKYNPGGVSQNYAVTISLRCTLGKRMLSEAYGGRSYDEIYIKCTKNSRGPTGRAICVRKYWRPRNDGISTFWWDWGRTTAEYLAELGDKHPLRDVLSVSKITNDKFSCKQLGMKDETPDVLGNAVMADRTLVDQCVPILQLRNVKEFSRLTDAEHEQMQKLASAAHLEYMQANGFNVADEALIDEPDGASLKEAEVQEQEGSTFDDDENGGF